MKRGLLFLFLSVCILTGSKSIAQSNWELAKEKDGIKVFTKKDAGAKFKSIRVEANIAGTMDKLMKILLDASGNKAWVYATEESYTIKKLSSNEILSYTQTAVPWPASNRDVPLRLRFNQDRNNLNIIIKGVPNAIPPKKGVVRIPYFNSSWDVKFDGRNRLNIVYFLEVDPGGSIPAWLNNLFVAKGPYETFNSLAKLMK